MQPGRSRPLFGIAVPQFANDDDAIANIAKYVRRAESLGFESAWVMDGIVTDQPCLEPLSLLSYLAGMTDGLRIGVAVLLLPLRNPVLLAKELATIDLLSRGRLVVGIGLGEDATPYSVFGGTREERVDRLEEGVELLRRLWTEPRTSFDGHFAVLDDIPLEPKPCQPRLPLWFGGRAPGALRRAVRLGDGWIGAGASSTADFAAHAEVIRDHLAREHRSRAFSIAKRCYVAFGRDRSTAVDRARGFFQALYGQPAMADRVVVGGSTEECIDQLAQVCAAGPDLVLLNPLDQDIAQMEWLAEDVLPALRGS